MISCSCAHWGFDENSVVYTELSQYLCINYRASFDSSLYPIPIGRKNILWNIAIYRSHKEVAIFKYLSFHRRHICALTSLSCFCFDLGTAKNKKLHTNLPQRTVFTAASKYHVFRSRQSNWIHYATMNYSWCHQFKDWVLNDSLFRDMWPATCIFYSGNSQSHPCAQNQIPKKVK